VQLRWAADGAGMKALAVPGWVRGALHADTYRQCLPRR
jgi:hypothetical protein